MASTVGIDAPAGPSIEVSDAEVAPRVAALAFLVATDPPALKSSNEWWTDDTPKRRSREGSDKACAWLLPFVPLNIAQLPLLQASQERGPCRASPIAIARNLRVLIREKRKAKEPHHELL